MLFVLSILINTPFLHVDQHPFFTYWSTPHFYVLINILFLRVDQHPFLTIWNTCRLNIYRWGWGWFWMVIKGGFHSCEKCQGWRWWEKWRHATPFFVMLINLTFSLVAQRYAIGSASTHIVEDVVIFWWWSTAAFIAMMNAMFWLVACWPLISCC